MSAKHYAIRIYLMDWRCDSRGRAQVSNKMYKMYNNMYLIRIHSIRMCLML
jgi:hypothetical protein